MFRYAAVLSRTVLAALLCVAGAPGCSSDDTPAAAAGSGGAAGATGDSGTTDAGWSCEQGAALEMSGTWAALLELHLELSSQAGGAVTLCPDHQINKATFLMLLRSTHQPGDTSLGQLEPTFCSLELPALTALVGECDPSATNLLIVDMLLSSKLKEAISSIPVASVAGQLGGPQPGASFGTERFAFAAGTRKTGNEMPSWQGAATGCGPADLAPGRGAACEPACVDDCEALVDDDKDGRAAVTLHVCGYTQDDIQASLPCNAENPSEASIAIQGPMLLDFYMNPMLTGTAASSCEVRGTVDTQVLYHVVGGDIYVANSQIGVASALKSLPLFDVSPTQSRFRMVRVDGAHGAPDWKLDVADRAAACAVVVKRRNDLL
jgi:hypothetical protein